MLCGALTGLNAITLTFPLDVARTRLAVQTQNSQIKEGGLISTMVTLWKTEGVKGLYKGYSITFIGSIPFVAIKQTSFDFLKRNCMIDQYKGILYFIYGSLSGLMGTVVLYPTYMIKRVIQANNKKDFKILPYVSDLIKRLGVKGLYQGMSMTLVKVIPYQGLNFYCNEKLKIWLKY